MILNITKGRGGNGARKKATTKGKIALAKRKQRAERNQIVAKLSREIASKITPDEKSQMESDGGIDTNELNTVLSKSNIKPSADITEKFNELDTNKNGKLEESEVSSAIERGRDYFQLSGGGCGIIMCPLLLPGYGNYLVTEPIG